MTTSREGTVFSDEELYDIDEEQTDIETDTDAFLHMSEKDNYMLTVKNIGNEVLTYFRGKVNESVETDLKNVNHDSVFYQIIAKSMEVIEIDNTVLHYIRKPIPGKEKLQLCLDVIIHVLEKYEILSDSSRDYYKALVYSGLIQETISLIADITKQKYKINHNYEKDEDQHIDTHNHSNNVNVTQTSPPSTLTSTSSSTSSSTSFWKYVTLKNVKRIFLFCDCCYNKDKNKDKDKKSKKTYLKGKK